MCQSASFVVTKNEVFFSESGDSHEHIIDENHLNHIDGLRNGLVRCEITPPDENYRLPLEQWVFHVDQTYLPEWANPKEMEEACRAKLPAWCKAHFVLEGEIDVKHGMTRIFFGKTIGNQYGGRAWYYDQTIGNLFMGVALYHGDSIGRQRGGHAQYYDDSTKNHTGGSFSDYRKYPKI